MKDEATLCLVENEARGILFGMAHQINMSVISFVGYFLAKMVKVRVLMQVMVTMNLISVRFFCFATHFSYILSAFYAFQILKNEKRSKFIN